MIWNIQKDQGLPKITYENLEWPRLTLLIVILIGYTPDEYEYVWLLKSTYTGRDTYNGSNIQNGRVHSKWEEDSDSEEYLAWEEDLDWEGDLDSVGY